ncbi:MAG: sigma-70 family RNA polymerase sigma factor [Armatimonadetes bacterium]|nr:sigma-70 family RNA polymerase sigma factor [Armatimonadota bacterium]
MTDAELVAAVRDGETEAFAVLVERYQDRVVAAAYHLTGDRDAAEDLAQDAFVAAFKQIHRLRDPSRVGAWLHGITQRLCYKYLRRASRSAELETERMEALPAPPDKVDEPGELIGLLNELPEQYRQVLAARYLEDLDYDEIARLLGTTVNNVRVRCHRAKNRLRELLESVQASDHRPRLLAGQGRTA